jgi:hypothetical protein
VSEVIEGGAFPRPSTKLTPEMEARIEAHRVASRQLDEAIKESAVLRRLSIEADLKVSVAVKAVDKARLE